MYVEQIKFQMSGLEWQHTAHILMQVHHVCLNSSGETNTALAKPLLLQDVSAPVSASRSARSTSVRVESLGHGQIVYNTILLAGTFQNACACDEEQTWSPTALLCLSLV